MTRDVFAVGFSLRKRQLVRRFVGGRKVSFVRSISRVLPGSDLLLWGSAPQPAGLPRDVRIIRMEDGFLRSVGLGADLTPPLSWVIDRRGMYYDATRPSDLEDILQNADFSASLLARADRLRRRIVESGITKYNVGKGGWKRPHHRRVILVPGQVETDASIRFGASAVRTNMGLLQAVRASHPHAHVLYKQHPDVVAGLRHQGRDEGNARLWCDEAVRDVSMADLLAKVDEVHVMTSLAGFEALLRGRQVTCYGNPFYAGWGLTSDVTPLPRRSRRLSLAMLVAGSLILYPTYASRLTGRIITPEQALDELLDWRAENPAEPSVMGKAYLSVKRRMLRRP